MLHIARRAVGALVWAVACASPAAAPAREPLAAEFSSEPPPRDKSHRFEPMRPVAVPLPGDDGGSAIPVPALPFHAEGSTCVFADDYLAPCTFLGGAPDIVYAYTPPRDLCLEVDLCGVAYDAAVFVYATDTGEILGCSDDACGVGARLAGLDLQEGRTVHVVVDGWYGACGAFGLDLRECPPPCPIATPPGAQPEGEPPCTDGVHDYTNAGCNDFPYAFTRLPCAVDSVVVAGTYGTFVDAYEELRDTDWYEIEVQSPGVLACRVQGAAATQLAILDGRLGCGEWSVACGSVLGEPCSEIACSAPVDPGRWWIFVATRAFQGVPCGTPYWLSVAGPVCTPVAARPADWGGVKRLYQ